MLSDEVETVIRQLIDSYYLRKERPRVIDLHRKIAPVCRSGGLPTPSYKAVWRRGNSIDPALMLKAREGAKATHTRSSLSARDSLLDHHAIAS
jgi:putative transposase